MSGKEIPEANGHLIAIAVALAIGTNLIPSTGDIWGVVFLAVAWVVGLLCGMGAPVGILRKVRK